MRLLLLLPLLMAVGCTTTGDSGAASVDADGDGSFTPDDCDDADPSVFPEAGETCNGVDNDCDGEVDDHAPDALAFFADGDGDGYGDAALRVLACDAPAGHVLDATDCDDANAAIHPDAAETDCADPVDYNCDGSVMYADADEDGAPACDDCDDTDAGRSPALAEVCDAADVDEDCDGLSDDADDSTEAGSMGTWYRDADQDGYSPGSGTSLTQCEVPVGYGAYVGDCDDYDAAISPGVDELCDPDDIDEDCDGLADDADPSTAPSSYIDYHRDADGDGYGDATRTASQCEAPPDYVADGADCDDGDATRSPGATELCDAADVDEDCDGLSDDADSTVTGATTFYADADGDTYGDPATSATACAAPAGTVANGDDCDDAKAGVHPGAIEVCDALDADEDCDGLSDDDDSSVSAASASTFYADTDGDGFGRATSATTACTLPSGFSTQSTDCDDGDADTYPGAAAHDSATACMNDDDGDDYGDTVVGSGVTAGTDCGDTSSAVSPAGTESCATPADDDCDGNTNEVGALSCTTYYYDGDSDGYGLLATSQCACAASGSYTATGVTSANDDCDDTDAAVSPGDVEVCDSANTDEDCDGLSDDDDSSTASGKVTRYADRDGDGFGTSTGTAFCDVPSGYSTSATDCDDADADTFPGAAASESGTACMNDDDHDGYGDTTAPSGGTAGTDCSDSASTVHPGATETCSTTADDDCDGNTNDIGAAACTTWYYDGDNDGYGVLTSSQCTCTASGSYDVSGVTSANDDCNDSSTAISPADTEICDSANTDEDCDGLADDADLSVSSTGKTTRYPDSDGDGYGTTTGVAYCDPPSSAKTTGTDCDDGDSDTFPGAASSDSTTACMNDDDGDNYGDSTAPSGGTAGTDCDDTRSAVKPGATETCSTTYDDDCDSSSNDIGATGCTTWYYDGDSDGYGLLTSTQCTCSASGDYDVSGVTSAIDDCDDVDDMVSPGAAEACGNSIDDDCDGTADEGCYYAGSYTADASTSTTTDADAAIRGRSASAAFGDLIVSGVDLDGDNHEDVAVSAKGGTYVSGSTYYGVIYVYDDAFPSASGDAESIDTALLYGATSATGPLPENLWGVPDLDADGVDELAFVYGTTTYFVEGSNIYGAASATSRSFDTVSLMTDVSGAGYTYSGATADDCFAGSDGTSSTQGATYKLYMTAGAVSSSLVVYGESVGDYSGHSVAGGPGNDPNGDGYDDLFVGAYGDDDGAVNAGAAYVMEMPASGTQYLAGASIKIRGNSSSQRFAYTVSAPGDVDGDGQADLALTAPWDDNGASNSGALYIYEDVDTDAATKDSAATDYEVRLLGDQANEALGMVDAQFGDINADGEIDVLVGSESWSNGTATGAGAAFLIYGPLSGSYDLSTDYDGRFVGTDASDACGSAVGLSDMDADGTDDLVIGCSGGDVGGSTDYGSALFFTGI